jgi:CRISPR-associated protein Cmr3
MRENGAKTRRPDFPYWPFEDVVTWSLGEEIEYKADHFSEVIDPEHRVHVSINDCSRTAEPQALFTTGGLRFGRDYGLALEVDDGRSQPQIPSDVQLATLGGEARAAHLRIRPGSCFPAFATVKNRYQRWIENQKGKTLGLRCQLMTPGCFGKWKPDWQRCAPAPLRAVCLDRAIPISGWNMQAGKPRAVRRLVPPGAIYLFGPVDSEQLLATCEELWGASLCAGIGGTEEHFIAAPALDGYGQVLPAPCILEPSEDS